MSHEQDECLKIKRATICKKWTFANKDFFQQVFNEFNSVESTMISNVNLQFSAPQIFVTPPDGDPEPYNVDG